MHSSSAYGDKMNGISHKKESLKLVIGHWVIGHWVIGHCRLPIAQCQLFIACYLPQDTFYPGVRVLHLGPAAVFHDQATARDRRSGPRGLLPSARSGHGQGYRVMATQTNGEYDPQSIMHYPVNKAFTLDGYEVGWNYNLSAGDKKTIASLYPFTTTTNY